MRDTKETLICPACGKEMHKIFIESVGFNLDICLDGCGGILFDNREFEHFDEEDENIDEILQVIEGKEFVEQDQSQVRVCPICAAPMIKNYITGDIDVEIDECYTCGAKFLDNNELQQIRSQYKNDSQRKEVFDRNFMALYGNRLKTDDVPQKNKILENSLILKMVKHLADSSRR